MSDGFNGFDGRDNRKTMMDLLRRLGHGLSVVEGDAARAGFLQGLVVLSDNGFSERLLIVDREGCTPGVAYHLLVAITHFGVSLEMATGLLEEMVRAREGREVAPLVPRPGWYLENAR